MDGVKEGQTKENGDKSEGEEGKGSTVDGGKNEVRVGERENGARQVSITGLQFSPSVSLGQPLPPHGSAFFISSDTVTRGHSSSREIYG